MKNIDFLPARYHERYAARAAMIKRWTIVLGISIIVTPLAVYQFLSHRWVVNNCVFVEPEFMRAQNKAKHLEELRAELVKAKGEAALLAWLSHPWPRSQVLAHISAPLPQSMRLTSIKMATEPKAADPNAPGRPRALRRSGDAQDPEATRPPAEKDLIRLVDEVSLNEHVVTLSGVTLNPTELHAYVAQLSATRLFQKSELRSLETAQGQDSAGHKFEIRLVLDAGHSLPPKVPAAAAKSNATAGQPTKSVLNLARRP